MTLALTIQINKDYNSLLYTEEHMKKFTALLLSVTMLFATLGATVIDIDTNVYAAKNEKETPDKDWPKGPDIFGTSACLIEASTGTVLYDKSCHKKMYPASITKIMTALLTIENANLGDTVTFSQNAIDSLEYDAANVGMVVGEEMSVEDCLYALMLHSANEVATALAEHVGGSVDEFANMMNERAKKAGAQGTHFANANGLFNENHYITAYDMAMITKDAVANPVFLNISGTNNYTLSKTNKKDAFTVYNRHKMLYKNNAYYYEGILGGKTGYTTESGTTLVTYARRNGMTLIAVVLNSNGYNVYKDTKLLFDYGFENFKLVNISENESKFDFESDFDFTDSLASPFGFKTDKALSIAADSCVVLPNNKNFADVTSSFDFTTREDAPASAIGTYSYYFNDKPVGYAPLVYKDTEKTAPTDSDSNSTDNTASSENSSKTDNNDDSSVDKNSDKNTDSNSVSDSKNNKNTKDTKSQKTKSKKHIKISKRFISIMVVVIVILAIVIAVVCYIRKKLRELNAIRESKRHRNRDLR